jgi:hypothetical protein
MLNVKIILLVILLLTVSVAGYFYLYKKQNEDTNQTEVLESYVDMPSVRHVHNVISTSNPEGSQQYFAVPGNLQSNLAPRAAPVDYHANITQNLPSDDKLGIPIEPLAEDCGVENKQEALGSGLIEEPEQVVNMDRLFTVSNQSRLLQNSDWIRGDLYICPDSNVQSGQWFTPSASTQPAAHLNPGALSFMENKENSEKLQSLTGSIVRSNYNVDPVSRYSNQYSVKGVGGVGPDIVVESE